MLCRWPRVALPRVLYLCLSSVHSEHCSPSPTAEEPGSTCTSAGTYALRLDSQITVVDEVFQLALTWTALASPQEDHGLWGARLLPA